MLKYILFLFCVLSISGQAEAMNQAESVSFDSIVKANVGNPAEIVNKLREIRNTSELADAFLCNFGGENFEEETSVRKNYSSEITERLVEAAFAIGSEMRKKGRSVTDEITDLEISKRFLEFANAKGSHGQADNDVSSSFWRDQLDGMIGVRRDYKDALDKLGILESDSESD
ncbi:MAG: hypothetical protein IJA14_00200 [Alphaproteobacteria bacterium]|nr:hypothetical protein [Alphaproteobacteria bacterium]